MTANPDSIPTVLFSCVHNAARSQMAAGLMRHHSGGRVEVFSGGSEPAEKVNSVAVEAMAEWASTSLRRPRDVGTWTTSTQPT